MAQPADTFSRYDAVGVREDLSDMIHNISPTETPFLTAAKKGKAANTYHEWQTDALAAVSDNKVIEGDEATTDAAAATVRLGNYTQIADKVVRVTGTVEAVSKAGRKKEMAYQMAKRSAELKRDMEHALVGLNNARVAGSDSVARELASVQAWLATNTDFDATSGADPTGDGTDARTDSSATRTLTEAMLKDVLQQCWASGGNPDVLMVSGPNKQVASGFSGGATRFDKSEDKKLTAAVDIYVSDFGQVRIVPNRFLRTRDALVLDMDYWGVDYLRPFNTHDLAKTGDTERKQLIVEYTLSARQEAASGIIADLA